MITRRPARLNTHSYEGCERYFLTMCCRNRRRWFEQAAVVEACRLEFLIAFRRRTTLATRFLTPGGLWQDGYFDRVLREDDEPDAVIDYILNNPVRAGLVEQAVNYPYSWSCTFDPNPRR